MSVVEFKEDVKAGLARNQAPPPEALFWVI